MPCLTYLTYINHYTSYTPLTYRMTGGKNRGKNAPSDQKTQSNSRRLSQRPNDSWSHRNRSESAAKRQRVVSDNESSSASDIVEFLETVSKDENSLKLFIEKLLKNQPIRNCLVDAIRSDVIDHLQSRIDSLEYRIDEMEQYSRRTCLKISGIPEPRSNTNNEDTDSKVLSVINDIILRSNDRKLSLREIGRTHRVGERKSGKIRDIIIRFISYRDRALVFSNKKNLKGSNDQNTDSKLYVNEALTAKRAGLFKKTRQLKRDKLIGNCWTHDGKILVRNIADDKTIHVKTEEDLTQFLKLRIHQESPHSNSRPNSTLNSSAHAFQPSGLTSTPMINGARGKSTDISNIGS